MEFSKNNVTRVDPIFVMITATIRGRCRVNVKRCCCWALLFSLGVRIQIVLIMCTYRRGQLLHVFHTLSDVAEFCTFKHQTKWTLNPGKKEKKQDSLSCNVSSWQQWIVIMTVCQSARRENYRPQKHDPRFQIDSRAFIRITLFLLLWLVDTFSNLQFK